ncbi:thioredoxin domain-containing protein [Saccharopolyspora erythraea]|uniref:DsbA family protein n=1 Tax=Saccharopolyspora erythraea TaxID=1836 RepID=UPI001BAD7AAC|nr:thioredoxin domain-containing protein [Saccharopolyspora erythraea]QUH04084.1 thioredoxin domain-containing protein [Saccharopolyspora erythraea]
MSKKYAKRGISINVVLTAVVVLVTVCVIGGVLLFHGSGPGAASGASLRKPGSNTLTEAPGEKVTVVEFLDYQCPSCASYYDNVIKQLEEDYTGRIDFATRDFPLPVHALAVPAAQAAEAAAMQGKYREMYHALYDGYESWAVAADGSGVSQDVSAARARFDEFAMRIGLDLERFHRDMASPQVMSKIEQDRSDGAKAGVSGTPTFFINGELFEPTGRTYDEVSKQFRTEIDSILAK